MTASDILKLQPGATVVYHRGFLAIDRDPVMSPLTQSERAIINREARTLHELARANKVALVQRRTGPGRFDYIARRLA